MVPDDSFAETDFPADPYPGARPDCSFTHLAGVCRPVALGAGWRVALDDWLTGQGAAPIAERVPVLAYGSNACPAKIGWLRGRFGLAGPAVVLRARCTGLAAVWAAGTRARDGQRPATLVAEPGRTEWHAVWLASLDQVAVLDQCEGRDVRYRLVKLRTGTVQLDSDIEAGTEIPGVLAYTAAGGIRAPLLVAGRPVRCADVPQAEAATLAGEPGPDGLAVEPVAGAPRPADWRMCWAA